MSSGHNGTKTKYPERIIAYYSRLKLCKQL